MGRLPTVRELFFKKRIQTNNYQREQGYYVRSGHKQFEDSRSAFERFYSPYPDYQSARYRSIYQGQFNACEGPRGRPLNDSIEDAIRVYDALPNEMPEPLIGSADAIGLHNGMCLDRVQRYAPYGGEEPSKYSPSYVDFEKVRWGQLQQQCVEQNEDRWEPTMRKSSVRTTIDSPEIEASELRANEDLRRDLKKDKTHKTRTAILLRTWEGYDYADSDIMAVRAMITELALQTGGEYQVFLMVNIKDRSEPVFSDPKAYKRMLRRVVPRELRDIAILWSEEICEKMYPDVGDWQVYWQQWMPVQWFSKNNPQFDFVWNWEMDVRYIGNHYHFLTQLSSFAERQPRKYLWERNARFYIPSFHGTDYNTYLNETNSIIQDSAQRGNLKPIWGPKTYASSQVPLGPRPPHSEDMDDFSWGVGEEADFMTLLPIWDPVKTKWTMTNKVWNFTPGIRPHFSDRHPTDDEFTHPSLKRLPRRGYINTVLRLSKRLINAMHEETLAGRSMQAEMWPSSVALHHGFKAVYVPHPVYSSVQWPGRYADAVFNADGGVPGRWGQEADSIYNQDREVNFKSWSWYYHAEFPKTLYRRWMGWKAEDRMGNLGGEGWEERDDGESPGGRMCLPPMLLHPVKRSHLDW